MISCGQAQIIKSSTGCSSRSSSSVGCFCIWTLDGEGDFFPPIPETAREQAEPSQPLQALTAELLQLARAHLGTAGSPWYFSAGSPSLCSSGFWWVPPHHGYVCISLLKPPLTPACCLPPLCAPLPLPLCFLVLPVVPLSPDTSLLQRCIPLHVSGHSLSHCHPQHASNIQLTATWL